MPLLARLQYQGWRKNITGTARAAAVLPGPGPGPVGPMCSARARSWIRLGRPALGPLAGRTCRTDHALGRPELDLEPHSCLNTAFSSAFTSLRVAVVAGSLKPVCGSRAMQASLYVNDWPVWALMITRVALP